MTPTAAHPKAALKVPDCTSLLQAMAQHQGADRGIHAAELATRMGVTRRILRKRISEARCQGFLVCGHPKTGYFMATTADELRMATAFLETPGPAQPAAAQPHARRGHARADGPAQAQPGVTRHPRTSFPTRSFQ